MFVSHSFQSAINTALLEAVNSNSSELVLQYVHLIVGGKLVGTGGGGGGSERDVVAMVDMRGLQFSSDDSNSTEVLITYHSSSSSSNGGFHQIVQVLHSHT